jgi:hypothetical protein
MPEEDRETLYVCKECGGWDRDKIRVIHDDEEVHRVEILSKRDNGTPGDDEEDEEEYF